MRRELLVFLIVALLFGFVAEVYATPATVGTSTSTTAVSNAQERGSAFINGQYWAWFSDGTNFKCFSSSDNGVGDAWAAATNWTTMAATSANRFDVAVQNVAPYKFRIVWCRSSNSYVYFQQGELEVDGSVTWDADGIQTVQTGLSTVFYPSIDYDGVGKVWLGYYYQYAVNSLRFRVHHNSVTTGTWTEASGFPVEPLTGQTNLRGLVLGKTTEACLCIYAKATPTIYSTDIASNGALSNVDAVASDTAAATSVTDWSATKNGDTAIMAWHKTGTNDWRYNQRVNNAWGSSTDVGASGVSGAMPPYVSVDTVSGTIYVFLVNYIANKYTYFAFSGGSPVQTDVSEGTGFYDRSTFQPSKQAYNSVITCVWLQSGSSPRNVRYDTISVAAAPSAWTWRFSTSSLVFDSEKWTIQKTFRETTLSSTLDSKRFLMQFRWKPNTLSLSVSAISIRRFFSFKPNTLSRAVESENWVIQKIFREASLSNSLDSSRFFMWYLWPENSLSSVAEAQNAVITSLFPIVEPQGSIISGIGTQELQGSYLYVPYCQLTPTTLLLDSVTTSTNFQITNKQSTPTTGVLTATITGINSTEILSNKTIPFTIAQHNQTIIPIVMHLPRSLNIFNNQYLMHITITYEGKKTSEALACFRPEVNAVFWLELCIYVAVLVFGIYALVWFLSNVVITKSKKPFHKQEDYGEVS